MTVSRLTSMSRNMLGRVGTASLLALCAGCRPTLVQNAVQPASPLQVVVGLEARGADAHGRTEPGSLTVIVRESGRPERVLWGAEVVLGTPGGSLRQDFQDAPYRARTASDGIARLDSLPPGAYVLRARLPGFAVHTVALEVQAGCPQRAEVYLMPTPSCLFSCPQLPARATITTCQRAT